MGKTYIKNYGVYSQHARNSPALLAIIQNKKNVSLDEYPAYAPDDIEITQRELIKREDRAVINTISKMAINALADLQKKMELSQLSEVMLYSACDSDEHSFETFRDIVHKGPEKFWQNISEFNKLSNPLDMLRLLPTNTLYHVSKILMNHHEGVPLRTASLSGMSALKMACRDICSGENAAGALVFSSANMKSFDSLTVFDKLNEIRHDENYRSGIIPGWGSVALHLNDKPEKALAELIAVTIHYKPKARFEKQDWLTLFSEQRDVNGKPDIVVSYDNGITEQAKVERDAIDEVFPGVNVVNYKKLTGYTGKSNNLLDILCCLNDNQIDSGCKVLLNGTGINYGLGCILLKKQDASL